MAKGAAQRINGTFATPLWEGGGNVKERALQEERRDPEQYAKVAAAVWDATIDECKGGFCLGALSNHRTAKNITVQLCF